MTAFLSWVLAPGGEGRAPGPRLENDDAEAWRFYCENATPFVREFGLMAGLLGELGLSGVAKDIFLARLNTIHNAVNEARLARSNAQTAAPADMMLAADPT